MKLLDSLTIGQKIFFSSLSIYILGALTLFIIGFYSSFSLLLWWFLGAVISSINFGLLVLQSHQVKRAALLNGSVNYMNLYIIRMGLIGLGLYLAATLSIGNLGVFWNVGAIFLAYMVQTVVTFVIGSYVPNVRKKL